MQPSVFLVVLGVAIVAQAFNDIPKGVNFIGVGHNLLEGNPEGGESSNGGVDPGLLNTRKVLASDPEVGIPGFTWPKGTYGLPMSKWGCPSAPGVEWLEGTRHLDTEDDGANNKWSSPYNLAGDVGKTGMEQKFCMKTQMRATVYDVDWPKGKYCIFKKGDCPTGFKDGFIYWNDEDTNNGNKYSGTLPDGTYNTNTRIEYCCRKDGSTDNAIILPTKWPFVLFQFDSNECQYVKGMRESSEYFEWDTEDEGGNNKAGGWRPYGTIDDNIKLHYCYYSSLSWPKGTYGLPMPKSGCPGDYWHEGTRYHDTEDNASGNNWSDRYTLKLAGDVGKSEMEQKFCMKTEMWYIGPDWPKGKYCIFKKGDCPTGFKEGYIYWDDEDTDNGNKYSGTLPDGTYDRNTRIEYCCRKDGNTTNAISLPTDSPFVLFMLGYLDCQKVRGMLVTMEYFTWDTEWYENGNTNDAGGLRPFGKADRYGIQLLYCSYVPDI